MKRAAYLLSLGLFTPACGLFTQAQTGPQAPISAASSPQAAPAAVASESPRADLHKVGDFYVHRFSGSYQKAPLTMTEEVIAQENGLWVIDYTFEEQSGTTKLRVRFDPRTDAVVRVSKLDGEKETSVPLAAYDKLIDRTSFAADSNEGMVASAHATCLVGPNELDCETKTYKVSVGDKQAMLNVSHSDSVPNGDVTGDITATDGTVIYRSELVEMGNAASPRHSVASR